MSPLRITIFSDFACPYSYLTEAAIGTLSEGETAAEYRAFELHPEPEPLPSAVLDANAWEALREAAEAEELPIERPEFVPRTRKAHEAARYARDGGSEAALRAEIFRAYWVAGRDIGRIDVLTELAGGVGLDAEGLKIALDIDRYTEEVVADEALARRLRIPGSPTIFLGTGPGARVVTGARGARELRDLVHDTIRTRATKAEDV